MNIPNNSSRNTLRPGFVIITTHQVDIVTIHHEPLYQFKKVNLSTLSLKQALVGTVEMMSDITTHRI